MTRHPALFTPVPLGRHSLRNRIVLPPLTRQRAAQPGDVPTALMARYYAQRASAGFMVSEGTQIEPRGQGYAAEFMAAFKAEVPNAHFRVTIANAM